MSHAFARPRRWLWVLLFVFVCIVIVGLAAGWNVVIVRDYRRIAELAGGATWSTRQTGIILGTLGFLIVLTTTAFFLARLLREMKLNQLQSEFLAHITHELRTPLASMELSADLLSRTDLSIEERERLRIAHSAELQRLRLQVDDLLEAARIEAGKPDARSRQWVKLEDWLQAQWPRWKNALGPDAELRREGERLDLFTEINPRALDRIFANLIDNARKFARDGRPRVTLITALRDWDWNISVRDEGQGFEPRDRKRIFHRFYRAEYQNTDESPRVAGSGLGLYIVRAACRMEGLRVQATSPGRGLGARFEVGGRIGAHA